MLFDILFGFIYVYFTYKLNSYIIDLLTLVMSLEIRPLAALQHPPPPIQKMCFIGLSVVAGGGLLMPTAFAPLSIASV